VASYIEDLPESRFTDATILRMYRLVDSGKTDKHLQDIAYGIVNRAMRGQWKNYKGEVERLFGWVKSNVDYRRDPHDVELLQDPIATISRRRGDCDDLAILLGAFCEILGNPCRFVTVSTRPDGAPSHVYSECFVGGRWEPMDASVQWSTVGWAPQAGIKNKKIWGRDAVGLAGYEERPRVEGLGMHSSMPNGWTDDGYNTSPGGDWEGGFASRMFRVKPPGIPDDISNTFAPGIPGAQVDPNRIIPSDLVSGNADDRRTLRSSDPTKPYPTEFPITSSPNPGADDYTLPRKDVPMPFDPNVWNPSGPSWSEDYTAMNPDGLGDASLNERSLDRQMLGELGDDYANLPPAQRAAARAEYRRQLAVAKRAANAAIAAKHAETHAARHATRLPPTANIRHEHYPSLIHGMNGMGSLVDDLAAKAKELLAAGAVKTVEQAAAVVTGKALPPVPPSTLTRILPSAEGPGLLLPGIAVAAVLYVVSQKGRR